MGWGPWVAVSDKFPNSKLNNFEILHCKQVGEVHFVALVASIYPFCALKHYYRYSGRNFRKIFTRRMNQDCAWHERLTAHSRPQRPRSFWSALKIRPLALVWPLVSPLARGPLLESPGKFSVAVKPLQNLEPCDYRAILFRYSKDEGRFPSYKKFQAYTLLRF